MSFERKFKRKKQIEYLKKEGIYCCGKPMLRKVIGEDEYGEEVLYFCEKCHKEKYFKEEEKIF